MGLTCGVGIGLDANVEVEVGFRDGLYQGIESEWPIRTPSRTDFNDVLPTKSVIRQTFNKSRVDEITHLEVTGVNLRLDNASTKFPNIIRMSRELALFQAQHPRQIQWLMGYAVEMLA